jgi:4-amino-4-deoxy-L-arabinose transferase-like glycosyltransferase
MKLLGSEGDSGAFSARLPSTLAMLATLLMLAIAITKQIGIGQAKWTVFIFATSAMTIVSAKSCLTDGVLVFFIIAAQLCFYRLWMGNRSWSTFIFLAIALGLGVLTKGPFIIGIIASTGTALAVFYALGKWWHGRPARVPKFQDTGGPPVPRKSPVPALQTPGLRYSQDPDSSQERSGPLEYLRTGVEKHSALNPLRILSQTSLALLIIAAMVLPWLWLVHHRAPDFLPAMLHEGKQHALEGKEGHHFPPGYHLVLVWAMFMPWSLLLPLAIGTAIRNLKVPEIRFALAAVVGPWIMVELMGTKLPHYFLPAYPAMAYLVAFAIRRCLAGETTGVESKGFLIGAGLWAAAVAAICCLPWLAVRYFPFSRTRDHLPFADMIVVTAVGLLVASAVFFLLRTRRFASAFLAMGVGMAIVIGANVQLFMDAKYLRISSRAGAWLTLLHSPNRDDVRMVDYKEPSLGFYQGGTIREVEKKADLIYKPIEQWPHWIVITREAWNMIPPATRMHLVVIHSYTGWAYADQCRVVEVMVVEKSVY